MYDFEFGARTAKGGFANERQYVRNLIIGKMTEMQNSGSRLWAMSQIK